MRSGDQPRRLKRLLVFDEAHRVRDSARLESLAREGRAFGVGIVMGTQFPGDVPETMAGNLATQLESGEAPKLDCSPDLRNDDWTRTQGTVGQAKALPTARWSDGPYSG
jgi:hypothetical protein